MYIMFLQAILLSVLYLQFSFSCICEQLDSDEHIFCASDFVAKVTVLDDGKIFYHNATRFNKVASKIAFGCTSLLLGNNTKTLVTPNTPETCGIAFKKNHDYLINGLMRYEEAEVFSCGFVIEWSFVPKRLQYKLINSKFCCRDFQPCTPIRKHLRKTLYPTMSPVANRIPFNRDVPNRKNNRGTTNPTTIHNMSTTFRNIRHSVNYSNMVSTTVAPAMFHYWTLLPLLAFVVIIIIY